MILQSHTGKHTCPDKISLKTTVTTKSPTNEKSSNLVALYCTSVTTN